MKRISLILLSLLLLYGSVAWALDLCLRHDDHSPRTATENHRGLEALPEHSYPQESSVPVIHCTPVSQEVGPAAQVIQAGFSRPDKEASFQTPLLPEALSPAVRDNLWLEPFRKILTFSLPHDLSRHLFLSVLQI